MSIQSIQLPGKSWFTLRFLSSLDHEGDEKKSIPGPAMKISGISSESDWSKPVMVQCRLVNESKESWSGFVEHALDYPSDKTAEFFLPGFMYGTNRAEHEKGLYPRMQKGEVNIPRSPWWAVRSDRLSHPLAAMYSENRIMGISAPPFVKGTSPSFCGFGCSCQSRQRVWYTLGYQNAPQFYMSNWHGYKKDFGNENKPLLLQPGEVLEYQFYLYSLEGNDQRVLNKLIRHCYDMFHNSPRTGQTARETVSSIAAAIDSVAYLPRYANYATQIYRKKDNSAEANSDRMAFEKNGMIYNAIPSIAWTGGVECAMPMLRAGLRMKNNQWRQNAIDCIESIVNDSLNPATGLPFDAMDNEGNRTVMGWWGGLLDKPSHSSYLIGEAIWYILNAYYWEKKLNGEKHSHWVTFCKQVLDRIARDQREDGAIPHLWDAETGLPWDYDAFAGAWCAAAMAKYDEVTKSESFFEKVRSAENHYHGFVKKMQCYGTPHDTFKAVDSEGILAYVRLCASLHRLSHEPKYAVHLKEGLEYEFTFKFCYNPPVEFEPLKRIGWSACGGSITSTSNPHIHPMSSAVLDELHYAVKIFPDDIYLKSRLSDTLNWSLQCHNRREGEFDFGEKGWLSERFCHSQALTTEKYPDGSPASVWFCFLPWGAANIVEGLTGYIWESFVD